VPLLWQTLTGDPVSPGLQVALQDWLMATQPAVQVKVALRGLKGGGAGQAASDAQTTYIIQQAGLC